MNMEIIKPFIEVLCDGVLIVDEHQHILHANKALCQMLGYREDELLDESIDRLIPPELRDSHRVIAASYQASGKNQLLMGRRPVLEAIRKCGSRVPISITLAKLPLEDSFQAVAVIREVPEEISNYKTLAEKDHLTGVANRLYFSERINQLIADKIEFELLYIDLDRFKPVNDKYGHEIGDEVLRIVSQRMHSCIRGSDLVARVGGDEFSILLKGLPAKTLMSVIKTIEDKITAPIHLNDKQISIGASFGSARYPVDGVNEAELMSLADASMYRAKRAS